MVSMQSSLGFKMNLLFLLLTLLLPVDLSAINFGPAVDLNMNQASVGLYPKISVNSVSNVDKAVATWLEQNGIVGNVLAKIFDGSKWSAIATNLNNDQTKNVNPPQVALSSSGEAMVVWAEEIDGGIVNVFAREFNGTIWLAPLNLNNNQASQAAATQIAINANGIAVAVWQESNGGFDNIFARTFNGSSWSVPTNLNNTQTVNASSPQVAINDNGTIVAVWTETNDGVDNVYARIFNGSTWSTAFDLNNTQTLNASSPQVSINNNDVAIVVWTEHFNIYSRVFEGTNWAASAHNLNSNVAENGDYPQIALNNNNIGIAVWQEQNGNATHVYARLFNGANWSLTSKDLNNDQLQNATLPQIAINDNETAIAVWNEYNNEIINVYARQFNGIDWSVVKNLSHKSNLAGLYPTITLNNRGLGFAAWSQGADSIFNVFARQMAISLLS